MARKAVARSQSKQSKMAAKSDHVAAEASSDDAAEEQQPSETVQEEVEEESELKVADQQSTSQPSSVSPSPSAPATPSSPKQEEESSTHQATPVSTPSNSKQNADLSASADSGTQLSASGRVQRVRQKPKRMNDDFYTDYSGKSWNNSIRGAQREVTTEGQTPAQEKTATQKTVQTGATSKRRTSQTKSTIASTLSLPVSCSQFLVYFVLLTFHLLQENETPTSSKEKSPVNVFEEDEESELSSSEEEFSSGEEEDDTI